MVRHFLQELMCFCWPDVLYHGCSDSVRSLEFSGCCFLLGMFPEGRWWQDLKEISISSSLKFGLMPRQFH